VQSADDPSGDAFPDTVGPSFTGGQPAAARLRTFLAQSTTAATSESSSTRPNRHRNVGTEIAARHRIDLNATITAMAQTAGDMNSNDNHTSQAGLAVSVTRC
jgi:hypothetical protein